MLWILEQDTFGYDDFDSDAKMVAAILEKGHTFIRYPKVTPLDRFDTKNIPPPSDGVIYRGSINFCRQVESSNLPFIPTTNWESFGFLNWATRYSEFLLNKDYFVLPYGDLHRRWKDINRYFGYPDDMFIRPNSGVKTFGGHVFTVEDYQRLQDPLNIPRDTIVILAPVYRIDHEYRFLVINNKIVSGSRYMSGGKLNIGSVPMNVWHYAENIATNIQIDLPICIVDISDDKGHLSLLEINRFESSELYDMDYHKVVSSIGSFYANW